MLKASETSLLPMSVILLCYWCTGSFFCSWLPDHITLLARFSGEPSPVKSTVTKAVAEFRRTHADTWNVQKDSFTEEQLEVYLHRTMNDHGFSIKLKIMMHSFCLLTFYFMLSGPSRYIIFVIIFCLIYICFPLPREGRFSRNTMIENSSNKFYELLISIVLVEL